MIIEPDEGAETRNDVLFFLLLAAEFIVPQLPVTDEPVCLHRMGQWHKIIRGLYRLGPYTRRFASIEGNGEKETIRFRWL